MILEGFDHEAFLRDYWQKQPLLIRHRGKVFVDPIEPDELAGLACELEMESRLVSRTENDSWRLRQGPFDPDTFGRLGERDWTLLVQAVDQVVPEVEALKRYFDFLPSWRIDDIMISYACDGGGVGPHFDQYDVFLVQGSGSRTWQIGQHCTTNTALRADTDLSILREFRPTAEYVLEPGDILYLPPRVAHHGVSRGESLCYSVGFRAPSLAELVQEVSDVLAATLNEDQRFEDPPFDALPEAGRIATGSLDCAFAKFTELVCNPALFSDALGSYVTRPRYPERIQPGDTEYTASQLLELMAGNTFLLARNPASRFSYLASGGQLRLYVDAQPFDCQPEQLPLVEALCRTPWTEVLELDKQQLNSPATGELLALLLNQGSLLSVPGSAFQNDDD